MDIALGRATGVLFLASAVASILVGAVFAYFLYMYRAVQTMHISVKKIYVTI